MRRTHLTTTARSLFAVIAAPILLALAVASGGCGEESIDLLRPTPDSTTTPGTTGPSMYRYYCSACHGLDGQPLVNASDDLRDYDRPFASFDSVLSAGPGLMPKYPELDQTERRLIYDHVISFTR
jgi:mono/diheme cytochrome c family protein